MTSVLCVDDNRVNLRLVATVAERSRADRVFTAATGAAALELIAAHRPDVILLDYHLPDRQGDDIVARIRRDPATTNTLVVLITADLTADLDDRFAGDPRTRTVAKPVDVHELLAVIDHEVTAGAC